MTQRNHHERGQGLVEYALILVLVAVACIIAMSTMGGRLRASFEYAVLAVEYNSLNALIDHCMEGSSASEISSMKEQATTNPTGFISSVNTMMDSGSMGRACGNRMLDYVE